MAAQDAPVLEDVEVSVVESKAKTALLKHGLKVIPGFDRVAVKRQRNILFAIDSPQVYKASGIEAYFVFGKIKVEDLLATQKAASGYSSGIAAEDVLPQEEDMPELEEAEEEEVDASGVEEKDIELVMNQAAVSRSKAIKALKGNDNDIVNAIMELTM